jgi:hypothetical protein
LQKLHHDQKYARLPSSFDSTMLDKLPDRYSHARYLASQPFDTQLPTPPQAQTQAQHQSGADNQSGAEDQFGADNLSQPDFSDFPDDLPLVDLRHINVRDRRPNETLDLSDINIADHVVSRTATQSRQPTQQSQVQPRIVTERNVYDSEDEIYFGDNDPPPLVHHSQESFSQASSQQHISTDEVEVTFITDPIANITITEYKNIEHPLCVHVENVDPTQRVTELQINPKTKPIEVKVVSEPRDGMIEDLPTLRAPRRPIKRQQREQPAENPYKKKLRSYAQPGSTSKYNLRSKTRTTDQANNAKLLYFEPP